MCGRYTLHVTGEMLAEQFRLPEVPALPPRYNIAPTQDVAVVRRKDSQYTLDMLRWGLIPAWADSDKIGARMINARTETVAEKPAFRAAFARRRCLIPADGFYEWQRTATSKQPFYFHLQTRQPFAFAGLWEQWRTQHGTLIESCTLLTTEANEVVRPVHARMPVILHEHDYALWLDPATQTADTLHPLLHAYPAAEMVAYPVSAYVNTPAHDDAGCIVPQ